MIRLKHNHPQPGGRWPEPVSAAAVRKAEEAHRAIAARQGKRPPPSDLARQIDDAGLKPIGSTAITTEERQLIEQHAREQAAIGRYHVD